MALLACVVTATSCTDKSVKQENPFFTQWDTPFETPPFDKIKLEHYMPAFDSAMVAEKAEIDSIINNPEAPTFDNTILAMDRSGALLSKVSEVFYGITATDMTPELEELQGQVSEKLTAHSSDISLNAKLFERVKAVYNNMDGLDDQQKRLTEKRYKSFERSGANLDEQEKQTLRGLDQQLSRLELNFGKNLRLDNGKFLLVIDSQEQLTGLSESIVAAAAAEAKSRQMGGKWVFTLDKSSMIPFLQYSDQRALREQLYKGYLERCNNNDDNDNKSIIDSIVNLRLQRARLLGFANHADYTLDRVMAKEPEAVYALLSELWKPALKRAAAEKDEMSQIMKADGVEGEIESWDWWYYAEKLRKAKYALNEEQLRPYFTLDNVRQGLFDLTTKLYGLTYREITNEVPKYNPENRVFEVLDQDSSHLGVVYFDFHPRAGKRVGAWCGGFREQSYGVDGKMVTPIVSIVCNFTKAIGDDPALLNLDEVETLFHEYGHGLHSLFKNVKYKGLNDVERDFVELPSQIMENWAFEPQVMKTYAKHYKTGEVIPQELIEKIQKSALFNQGFATVEYLGASLLDMDYSTVVEQGKIDVPSFEKVSLERYGSMKEIAPRYRSTYFQHIFSGGYSSGYYSYIWAEVLDSDAFDAFVQSGDVFNRELAQRFREELLSKGGTADGATLYQNFRHQAPSKEPLMKRRGLI